MPLGGYISHQTDISVLFTPIYKQLYFNNIKIANPFIEGNIDDALEIMIRGKPFYKNRISKIEFYLRPSEAKAWENAIKKYPRFREAVKIDATEIFLKEIEYTVVEKANLVCFIVGVPNSIPYSEKVLVRINGAEKSIEIGRVFDDFVSGKIISLEALAFDLRKRKFVWKPAIPIKHGINPIVIEVKGENGDKLLLTGDHSIPIIRKKKLRIVGAHQLRVGDKMISLDDDGGLREQIIEDLQIKQNSEVVYDLSVAEHHTFTTANGIVLMNSGKSEVAQTTAFLLKYYFIKYRRKAPNIYITFSHSETQSLLPQLDYGDVIIQDEVVQLSGVGSLSVYASIDNIMRTVRAKQISFIFVSPETKGSRLPFVNFLLETFGMNRKYRLNRVMFYTRYQEPIGYVILPLHNDEMLRAKYLEKKMGNIDRLLDSAGTVGGVSADKFKMDAKAVVRAILEQAETIDDIQETVKRKSRIQGIAFSLGISGATEYLKSLVDYVALMVERILRVIALRRRNFDYPITDDIKDFEPLIQKFVRI